MCVFIMIDSGAYYARLWVASTGERVRYVMTPTDYRPGGFGGAVVEDAGNLWRVSLSEIESRAISPHAEFIHTVDSILVLPVPGHARMTFSSTVGSVANAKDTAVCTTPKCTPTIRFRDCETWVVDGEGIWGMVGGGGSPFLSYPPR